MALPSIASYPMPGEHELPANRVTWQPDPRRAALLIHDMQRYFLDAFTAGKSPIVELLANIRRLHEAAAQQGIPVLYTAQPGAQDPVQRGLLSDFWGPGLDDGPHQQAIAAEVAPAPDDLIVPKWRYSAFRKSDLIAQLFDRGRDQLIVCGVYAHIGCLMTACDAFMQDIQPFLVADAVADFSRQHHEMALAFVAQRCGVTLSTRQAIEALQRETVPANEAQTATSPSTHAAESVQQTEITPVEAGQRR